MGHFAAAFKTLWTVEALGAGAATTASDLPDFAKYGVLGLILVALLVGWLVPGYIYKALTARAEAAEERERKLRETVDNETLPLMREVASTMKDFNITVREALAIIRTRPL